MHNEQDPCLIRSLKGHKESIMSLDLHPTCKYVASAGMDNVILLWDLTRQAQPKKLLGHKVALFLNRIKSITSSSAPTALCQFLQVATSHSSFGKQISIPQLKRSLSSKLTMHVFEELAFRVMDFCWLHVEMINWSKYGPRLIVVFSTLLNSTIIGYAIVSSHPQLQIQYLAMIK